MRRSLIRKDADLVPIEQPLTTRFGPFLQSATSMPDLETVFFSLFSCDSSRGRSIDRSRSETSLSPKAMISVSSQEACDFFSFAESSSSCFRSRAAARLLYEMNGMSEMHDWSQRK